MRKMNMALIDLRVLKNDKCSKCQNQAQRDEYAENDFCNKVDSVLDNLQMRCVGEWAYEKIYWLVQYFGIFSKGMHKRWQGLNYIELCSGPGRCVVRNTGEEIDGTSLAILNNPNSQYLQKVIFIDLNQNAVNILNKRIEKLGIQSKAKAVVGNYAKSEDIIALLKGLSQNCLNLAFIDPTQCDIPFETITAIVNNIPNLDLLINVSIGTDINRNIKQAVLDASYVNVRKKYELFLGDESFFRQASVMSAAQKGSMQELRKLFSEAYSNKLNALGFKFRDIKPVKQYYYLLFASKNKTGLEFWKKACTYTPDGQKEFNFQ
jgi:three-Cys-motif partner protein